MTKSNPLESLLPDYLSLIPKDGSKQLTVVKTLESLAEPSSEYTINQVLNDHLPVTPSVMGVRAPNHFADENDGVPRPSSSREENKTAEIPTDYQALGKPPRSSQ